MRHLTASLAFCLMASSVFAQVGSGSITGTLDLHPARWTVATAGEEPTSSWTNKNTGAEIRLVGTPEAESGGGPGTLTIEIDVTTGPVEARATDFRVELRQTEGTLVAQNENIELSLEAFQTAGEDLVVAGSFIATLTPEPIDRLLIDPDKGVVLDGNFQATIRKTQPVSSN